MVAYSLYIHIPFCVHRCAYCDFNTYAGLEALRTEYVKALCAEAAYVAVAAGERLTAHTIYFGGGTPSLLTLHQVATVLETLYREFKVQADVEITLEANPGTVSLETLREMRRLGVNRLSLGMQSAHSQELRLLERQHDVFEVFQAVRWARKAGFDNLNLDLIFGLPGQLVQTWMQTLEVALSLTPEHLSLYALTLEPGTPMQHWVARGVLAEPDADLAAEMYERAAERLEQAGFLQYEISNWALAGGQNRQCRHNLQYWRSEPYLGLGAGAHGYAAGKRTANVLSPPVYVQRMNAQPKSRFAFPLTPATDSAQTIDQHTEMSEVMMMGLRLVQEGVSDLRFAERFGQSLRRVFGRQIDRLIAFGLLEWTGEGEDTLRLTKRGKLLGNQVFMEFL